MYSGARSRHDRGVGQAWIGVVAASLGWGVASPLVRTIMERGATASGVIAVRLAIVTAVVGLAALLLGIRPSREAWKVGILIGIPRIAGTPLFMISALAFVGASFQSVILTFIPALTSTLAWIFLKERLSARQIAGLVLGLAGILVLILGGDSGIADGSGDTLVGGLLGLIGVAAGAGSAVLMRNFAPRYDTRSLAIPMFVSGGLVAVAASPLAAGNLNLAELDRISWMVLVGLALGSSLLPFLATLFSSRYLPAAQVAITGYAAPLISIALGIVLVGERVTAPLVVGGALAIAGMVLVTNRSVEPARATHPATRA